MNPTILFFSACATRMLLPLVAAAAVLACLGMGEAFLVSAPPASRHFLQRDLPLKCGAHKIARQRPSARGLRMQSSDPQWYAFQGYNLGKWTGTAMHIDPETGDYAQPYVIRQYTLEVTEHEVGEGGYAGQSGVERIEAAASKTLPSLAATKTIVPDDDFDATPDGAYSLDQRGVRIPDTDVTASLVVELSLPMSDDERVRCEVVYDNESKLRLIILREELRAGASAAVPAASSGGKPNTGSGGFASSSGSKLSSKIGSSASKKGGKPAEETPAATPTKATRAPLQLEDIVGTVSEQVSLSFRSRAHGGKM